MVGRNSTEKRPATVSAGTPDAAAPTTPSSLETHSVPPPPGSAAEPAPGSTPEPANSPRKTNSHVAEAAPPQDAPLGSVKRKPQPPIAPAAADSGPAGGYLPQSGQTFLQVAAVGRNEADGIADVLNKKGFHAHSVPKPGSPVIYRVLIGPIRDTADLSSTREALRNTAGFRDVIVQHY